MKLDLNELKRKYKELGKAIECMERGGGKPRVKDVYYFWNSALYLKSERWIGLTYDLSRWHNNNVYRTKEAAETYMRVFRHAIMLIGDWEPDWEDDCDDKYWLMYNHKQERVEKSISGVCQYQHVIYMPEYAVDALLNEFTQDELRIFVCGGRYDD